MEGFGSGVWVKGMWKRVDLGEYMFAAEWLEKGRVSGMAQHEVYYDSGSETY